MDYDGFSRYRFLRVLSLIVLPAYFLLRLVLTIHQWSELDHHIPSLLKTFLLGELFDLSVASIILLPCALYFSLLPRRWVASSAQQWLSFLVLNFILYIFLFGVASEWIFWNEFGNRFNFIAVDYLIYTTEVVQNIRESYPVALIFSGLALLTLCFSIPAFRFLRPTMAPESNRQRLLVPLLLSLFVVFQLVLVSNGLAEFSTNNYNNELAKNGTYSFFSAFKNNSLNYKKFYALADDSKVEARVRERLSGSDSHFISSAPFDFTRNIQNPGSEKRYNVIYLTIESLSGSFLKTFGNQEGITPNLDALVKDSMFFTNMYAAGTRTVRGLEALSLALPPTPGNSILRRPENKGLFTVGQIFRDRNYDVKFIYGGYGYFDNMNDYFSKNEFDIVDRGSMAKDEVHFANAWGVCDEDLFARAIREADKSYANQKPFFSLVMSTSNHRPYTYPQKIDIRSGSTRQGAVKYTDYAIEEFLKVARTKPWFKNTIIVIMADHCASVAGKTSIPVPEFHIPLFFYAPNILSPKIVTKLMSQIDITPTILGLLNFSYKSKFFGQNIFRNTPERAVMATYQKLALYEKNRLVVLSPIRQVELFFVDPKTFVQKKIDDVSEPENADILLDAFSYYQSANYLYGGGHYLYDVREKH